jgi:hypothetical protein
MCGEIVFAKPDYTVMDDNYALLVQEDKVSCLAIFFGHALTRRFERDAVTYEPQAQLIAEAIVANNRHRVLPIAQETLLGTTMVGFSPRSRLPKPLSLPSSLPNIPLSLLSYKGLYRPTT